MARDSAIGAATRRPLPRIVWSRESPDPPDALELNAPPHMVMLHRGYMLAMAGQPRRAIPLFERSIELQPDHSQAHYLMGWSLCRIREFDVAIDALKKAAELNPGYVDIFTTLGIALSDVGNHTDAIEVFSKALALSPNSAREHYNLGVALELSYELAPSYEESKPFLEKAIEFYHKATELDPAYADAYWGWGVMLRRASRAGEAVFALRKALELDPTNENGLQECQSALNSFQGTASKSFHFVSLVSAAFCAV